MQQVAIKVHDCKTRPRFPINEIINVDNKIKALEAEIAALESKISKEKQFNRKVEINKVLLEKKAMLAEIMRGSK